MRNNNNQKNVYIIVESLSTQTRERKAKRLQGTERKREVTIVEAILHFAQLHQYVIRIGLVNNLKVVLGAEFGATIVVQHKLPQLVVIVWLAVLENIRDPVPLGIGGTRAQTRSTGDLSRLANDLLVFHGQNFTARHQVVVLQL